jgi:hypothetical protein
VLRPLGLAVLALLAAGCMKADISLTVSSNGIVDGTLLVGYERTFITGTGAELTQWQTDFAASLEDPGGSGPPLDCEPWGDETYVGVDCSLVGATLADVSAHDRLGGSLTLERDADQIHAFTMIDLSHFPEGMPNFDIQLEVTFPGPILRQTNGSAAERTVTWAMPAGQRTQIDALAGIGPTASDGGGTLPVLAIGLGAAGLLVSIGVGVVVVLLRRRRASPG